MTQLLQNALYGAALILAAAALRRVLKDRLIPQARLALWAACLFRLLTPAAPESALSLWSLFIRPEPVSPPPPQLYTPAPAIVPAPAPLPQPEPAGFPWETALGWAWLAVGLILGLWYALSWRRTRRAVSAAIPIPRPDPRYLLLPPCARLREGPMEGAPLTFGAVRPTVVLSPGLSGEELACVLAHEGVHARRRDNLWHYAMALALAVHWWNPAVWLMSRLLRQDVELACDRAAVKALGPDKRAQYANALVTLGTQADGPAFCQTFGRKAAEERIRSIMKFKKLSVLGVVFTLALVVAVTAAFASDPKTAPDEESTTSSAPAGLAFGTTSDPDSGALKSFTINLDYLEQNLTEHVAGGSMTQEEAAQIMEQARALAEDGVLEWTFNEDSGLVTGPDGSDTVGSGIFFKGDGGKLYLMDPAQVAAFLLVPAAETVEYHGRTYLQASLSQETLEWLDWYLALPGEEQLAVSYEPAELRPETPPETSDAQDDLPADVLMYAQGLSIGMPRDEVRALLGEPSFSSSSLHSDTYELDPGSFARQLGIFYELDGTVAQVRYYSDGTDPDCAGVDLAPFLADGGAYPFLSYPDTPRETFRAEYEAVLNRSAARGVRDQSDVDRLLSKLDELMDQSDAGIISGLSFSKKANGELGYVPNAGSAVRTSGGLYDLCADKSCEVSYDHCHLDGKVVRVYYQSPGLLCAHDGCALDKPHAHDGVQYAGKAPEAYVVLDPGQAPAPSNPPAKAFDDYTITGTDENGYPVDEQGNQLIFDGNGKLFMKVRQGNSPCIREDCGISREHYHKDGEVVYTYTEAGLLCQRPDCEETGIHTHDGLTYKAIANVCTRPDCGETGVHTHDGVTYKGWTGKLPADAPVPSAAPVSTAHHADSHSNGAHH